MINYENKNHNVSIGICAYNEEKNIARLLSNLLTEQDLSLDSEIIVICSGCTDSTPEIVRSFCEKDRRVKLIVEPTRNGKISALNKILSLYDGDYFVNLDADHMPLPGAISYLIPHFKNPSVGVVSGCQIPIDRDGFMAKIGQTVWSLHNSTQCYCNHHGVDQHLGGVLFAIKRGVCDHIPEDIVNDDGYIGVDARRKGFKVLFEERARALFRTPETIPEYITQRRRFVYGHLKVKKETGVSPMVLQMCHPSDQIKILLDWFVRNPHLSLYFFVACVLEAYINFLVRLDIMKKSNPYKIWRIAESTKMEVPLR